MSDKIKPGDVLAAYVSTKAEIARLEAELKEKLEPLKKFQEARLQFLHKVMDEQGTTQLKAEGVATCFFKRKETLRVTDATAFFNFVEANKRFDLVKKDVVKSVALEYMGEERDSPPPPGCEYTSFREVHVNKAR